MRVSPHWIIAGIWALLGIGCRDITSESASGALIVTITTSGPDAPLDGYDILINNISRRRAPIAGQVDIGALGQGTYVVAISGLPPNCGATNGGRATVELRRGQTVTVTFDVVCVPYFVALRISAATTGEDHDEDGFTVYVNGTRKGTVSANGTTSIDRIHPGNHSVELRDLAPNCQVVGANPQWVGPAGAVTLDIAFDVACEAFARLRISTSTTGSDPGLDDLRFSVHSDAAVAADGNVPANGSIIVGRLLAGTWTVTISDIAVNCDIIGSPNRAITAVSGSIVEVTFAIACSPVTRLAFSSDESGRSQLYAVNANGKNHVRLLASLSRDLEPSWSPDGSQLAFRSDRGGNHDIYVLDMDGGVVRRLTDHVASDHSPAWSPDGSRIAFVSERDDGRGDIYVMNADGSNVQRLTESTSEDADPAWSPDGTRIVFRSDRGGQSFQIYGMKVDGSDVTRLTEGAASAYSPAWSPDGTRIAFARRGACYYWGECGQIVVMYADGSEATTIASDGDDGQPAWSPDGRWIAFSRNGCDDYYSYYYGSGSCTLGLTISNLTGSDQRALVAGVATGKPSWRR